MPAYDPLNGVYRADSVNPAVRSFDSGAYTQDIINGSDDTINVSVAKRIFAIVVSVTPNPAGGIPFGSVLNGRLNISIDGNNVSSYNLPSNNEWGTYINEVVPFNYDTYNPAVVTISTDGDSGQDYTINIRVVVYALDR